jgi:hypothetical protein
MSRLTVDELEQSSVLSIEMIDGHENHIVRFQATAEAYERIISAQDGANDPQRTSDVQHFFLDPLLCFTSGIPN